MQQSKIVYNSYRMKSTRSILSSIGIRLKFRRGILKLSHTRKGSSKARFYISSGRGIQNLVSQNPSSGSKNKNSGKTEGDIDQAMEWGLYTEVRSGDQEWSVGIVAGEFGVPGQ